MTMTKLVNGVRVALTAEEEAAIIAEREAAANTPRPERKTQEQLIDERVGVMLKSLSLATDEQIDTALEITREAPATR